MINVSRLYASIKFSAIIGVSYWATTVYENAFDNVLLTIGAFLFVAFILYLFGGSFLDMIDDNEKRTTKSIVKPANNIDYTQLREWLNTIIAFGLLIVAIIGLYQIIELNISLETLTSGTIETRMINFYNETGRVACMYVENTTFYTASDDDCPSGTANPFSSLIK